MTEKLSTDEFLYRKENFDENYKRIKEEMNQAAIKARRNPDEILLLAATKTVPVEIINYATAQGIKAIGENRVQEFLSKYNELEKSADMQFIGTLQTNKVKQIVGKVSLIHSVHSVKLAETIAKESINQNSVSDILIEVNIGGEESKTGISETNIFELLYEIAQIKGVRVMGLMAIPPIFENVTKNSSYFNKMRKLFIDIQGKKIDNVYMKFLSMGMSDDFALAISEGSNIVRIGTALFGKRI